MWFPKDPDAARKFSVDWNTWAAAEGDNIAYAEWVLPDEGLYVPEDRPQPSLVSGIATVWLAGGKVGEIYEVTSRVGSTAGRTEDSTIYIEIIQR